MKKIQQFFIYKFNSNRLKDSKYNIRNIDLSDARMDGELVSLSNSEMIRTIFRITNREFSQYHLNELITERKRLSRKKNNPKNRELLKELHSKIDSYLFIPELVSVFFENRKHFKKILEKGYFQINGCKYVPFMASAGMIRRDTSLFIDMELKEKIDKVLNNDRNRSVEIVPAKFLAYYSLYSSSTIPVTFPRIAIVPDLLIKDKKMVDYSTYMGEGIDPLIEEKEMELEFNAFDGQGLCSPAFAKTMQQDLELDYVPSILGIRAPFLKGMVCIFDFEKFSKNVVKKDTFIDIYGNTVFVKDVDCIISESQFKLWSSYPNTQAYVDACKNNNLGFGITKVNPKVDKNHAKTSYQFLQILKLNDEDIEKLCESTLDWLKDVSSGNVSSTLLYMLGETDFSDGWFQRLDITTQAILLENELLNDPYIIKHLEQSINKKKNDAKFGRLIFNGNYSTMISDPYAMCAHVFGMGLKSLLGEFEHYSEYWNKRSIKQVAAIRSPIVHSSEVNVLNFQDTEMTREWYKHIHSGIIFPANGVGMDAAIGGGADFDLDLICTIHSEEIIKGRTQGHPVLYDVKKADKVLLDENYESLLHDSQYIQVKTNKIGFLTNVSSTMYSLLYNFEKGSPEHNAILQRLKYGRVAQGLEIDKTKGILTDPFPEHFTKWQKIKPDMSDDEKERRAFNNKILSDRRPYFMRWLYPHFNKRYKWEMDTYNNISQTKWRMNFEDLLNRTELTKEQKDLCQKYKRRTFFINNNSTMNRISKHIEEQLKNVRFERRIKAKDFNYKKLLSFNEYRPSPVNVEKIKILFREWKSLNRSFRESSFDGDNDKYMSLEQINEYIKQRAYLTISSNSIDLANLVIWACYKEMGIQSRSFAWRCFGLEILQNIKERYSERYVRVPILNEKGSHEYLWSNYGIYLLQLKNEEK